MDPTDLLFVGLQGSSIGCGTFAATWIDVAVAGGDPPVVFDSGRGRKT
jgi:hypothetical protein